MSHDPQQQDPRELGHEPDQVATRTILFWGVMLAVTVVIAFGSMMAFKNILDRALNDNPVVGNDCRDETPIPAGMAALNPDQSAELDQLRDSQRAWLHEYQWTDRAAGIARIPIERAMEIVAKNGVPATLPAVTTEAAPPKKP